MSDNQISTTTADREAERLYHEALLAAAPALLIEASNGLENAADDAGLCTLCGRTAETGLYVTPGRHSPDCIVTHLRDTSAALSARDARIEALEKAMEWQPMPPANYKDGDKIIGQFPHGTYDIVCIAKYNSHVKRWFDTAEGSCVAWPNGNDRPAFYMPVPAARAVLSPNTGEG